MNILIVDDISTNRKLSRAILEAEDYTVLEATDGADALAILEREKVDAIFSDILMPRMDGYRFCYEVRASTRFHSLPFIFYTAAYTSPGDEKLALEMGADKFLVKPASNSKILQIVREATTESRGVVTPSEPSRALSLLKDYSQRLVGKLEEKNAELTTRNEELVRSEQKLLLQGTALETTANAVVITDAVGTILWVNAAFVTLTGYRAEEVIGKNPSLLKSGKHDRKFYKKLWDTIMAGETWRGGFINRRKNGSYYQDEHTITPVRSATGAITHFVTIMDEVTERQQAERDFTSAVLDTAGSLVVVLDPQGRIVRFNRACEQLTGCTFNEVKGRNAMDLFLTPEERAGVAAVFENICAGQFPSTHENFWLTRTGDRRLISWCNTALFDEIGTVEFVIGTGIDITEHRQMEVMRRESEGKFRALFDVANDAIYLLHNGLFVDSNAKGLELFGLTRDKILGKSPSLFSPLTQPDGRNSQEKVMELTQRAMAGEPQFFEWAQLRANGTTVFTDVSLSRLELGGKIYVQAIARDTTERKRVEEEIAQQAALLDKARDAIVVRDLEGHVRFWNKGAERIYGWSREEVTGRDIRELLYLDPEKFKKVNDVVISKGEWSGELQQTTKDQRQITIESRWTLIRDLEGNPKAVMAINTDITEKKKIEGQFMRAQRMESIGTLAGGIAHDLNNILAPIMMSIDILKDISIDPQAQKILTTLETSAQRGADIVRQILSFARGLEGQRIEVQPKHLIKDLGSIIRNTFPKNIRLQFSVPNDIWVILGDPTQVHQILLNLCVNARDAMPHGGTLSVDVENCVLDEHYAAMNVQANPGNYVNISVTDSGTGMPPAILDKIFEPFFTTKELDKGTGLGLSTVMSIVKSHGGIVNVYSEVGKGTTFKVYLPATEISSQVQKQQSEVATLPRGNGETVLVVDDEPSILIITSQTLQAFGYRVLTATDGADALAVYVQHQKEIDVVLTDIAMPVMDGPSAAHALRRINPALKIISASGLNSNGGVKNGSGDGVQYFLTKPYTAGTLLTTLRTILDA
jgi:PAS domain S-box-containing protein